MILIPTQSVCLFGFSLVLVGLFFRYTLLMETQCSRTGRRPQKPRRVISKSGERNISLTNLPQRSKRYILDFITTIVRGL